MLLCPFADRESYCATAVSAVVSDHG